MSQNPQRRIFCRSFRNLTMSKSGIVSVLLCLVLSSAGVGEESTQTQIDDLLNYLELTIHSKEVIVEKPLYMQVFVRTTNSDYDQTYGEFAHTNFKAARLRFNFVEDKHGVVPKRGFFGDGGRSDGYRVTMRSFDTIEAKSRNLTSRFFLPAPPLADSDRGSEGGFGTAPWPVLSVAEATAGEIVVLKITRSNEKRTAVTELVVQFSEKPFEKKLPTYRVLP